MRDEPAFTPVTDDTSQSTLNSLPSNATPRINYVTRFNLNSLSTLPLDIHFDVFEYLPQKELLNCMEALPFYQEIIGRVLSRRIIRVNVREYRDPGPMIRKLRPFTRKLHLNFDSDNSQGGQHRQRIWLKAMISYSRLQHLELFNFTACVRGPLGVDIRHLYIGGATITDDILVSYVPAIMSPYVRPVLETLLLYNVNWLSGICLQKMPLVQNLLIHNLRNSYRFFQPEHLVQYVAQNDVLRKFHFESSELDFDALQADFFPLLRNVDDLHFRDNYSNELDIYDERVAIKFAQLPKVAKLNVHMTAPALSAFFDAVPDGSPLTWLYVKLHTFLYPVQVLQKCHLTSAKRLQNLTAINLDVPIPCMSRLNEQNQSDFRVRCSLATLVEQLAVLPALNILIISSISARKYGAPVDVDVFPHDLTGDLLAKHLPRLQHLSVELPCLELRGLASMKQLISLEVTFLRLYVQHKQVATLRDRCVHENRSVNQWLRDLCALEHLQKLSVFGSQLQLSTTTCRRFAVSRIRILELSLGQIVQKLVLMLKRARTVRTFIDGRCNADVWNERTMLQTACPHVHHWKLQPLQNGAEQNILHIG